MRPEDCDFAVVLGGGMGMPGPGGPMGFQTIPSKFEKVFENEYGTLYRNPAKVEHAREPLRPAVSLPLLAVTGRSRVPVGARRLPSAAPAAVPPCGRGGRHDRCRACASCRLPAPRSASFAIHRQPRRRRPKARSVSALRASVVRASVLPVSAFPASLTRRRERRTPARGSLRVRRLPERRRRTRKPEARSQRPALANNRDESLVPSPDGF